MLNPGRGRSATPQFALKTAIAALATLLPMTALLAQTQKPDSAPAVKYAALVHTYCSGCHNPKLTSGGLDLASLSLTDVSAHGREWEAVVAKLRVRTMPPVGMPKPDAQTMAGFKSFLEGELDRSWAAHPNPGRTETLHRLNRTEYQNAVRDLLALDVNVTDLLPGDDSSNGFDNMAGTLRMSQSLMERYLSAARTVSRLAVGSPLPGVDSRTYRIPPDLEQNDHIEGLPFGTRGGAIIRHLFPREGDYDIRADLAGAQRPATPQQFEISLDDEQVKLQTLGERRAPPGGSQNSVTVRVHVTGGSHEIAATFFGKPPDLLEQFREPFENPVIAGNNGGFGGPEPLLTAIAVTGPYNDRGPGDTASRKRIFTCHPASAEAEDACARKIISTLSRRAYRGPVVEADFDSLMKFYRDGRADDGSFEQGIELALRKMLVTPAFLYRLEADPAGQKPAPFNYRLGDLELASRLSFFIWSSIPDDELLGVAERGGLKDPREYMRQVKRMMADPRSNALSLNFADEWLQLRNLETAQPSSPYTFVFDETLRRSMRRETELFFDSILQDNRPAPELLTARYTFLDQRLAEHYGIPNVQGATFRRVELAENSPRRGLIGQGSILTITSHPNRTSPVLRGKFLLKNLLGAPPSDPPPNVPALPEARTQAHTETMRARMGVHRANPACASCHNVIDPAGFALESFDAVGRYRVKDESFNALDTSGALPDGTKFSNVAELRTALTRDPEPFVHALTEKLLTYSLGRGLEYYDMPAVRKIVRDAASDGYRMQALLTGIVNSAPFQMRRKD